MMKKRMTAGMLATLMAAVLPVSACAAQNSAPQPQLNTAEHMQYMNGYTDGTFRPDASITRAEASKLLTSLLVDWGEHRDYLFSDVSVSAWYANAVCQMINFGLVNGYTDGTFKPNAKITRAEFVAILSRFPHTDIGTDKSFADVPRTNWAYNAVQTALAQGWISAGTNFRPNAPITRAEFAAIAARFDDKNTDTSSKFTVIASHWAKNEIGIAANKGWINGYPDGTFRPNQYITRAEAMTLVNRVLNRLPENSSDLLDSMIKWPDNSDASAWYYLAVQEATNSHAYSDKSKDDKYEKWTTIRDARDWTELEK